MKYFLTIFLFNINAFDSNAQNFCYQGGNGDGAASRKLYIQPLSSIQNLKKMQYHLIQNILSSADDKTIHIKLYNLLGMLGSLGLRMTFKPVRAAAKRHSKSAA